MRTRMFVSLAGVALSMSAMSATTADRSLPQIVNKDGRYALLVDGAPYLMLGAQVNNSSAWPAMLPKVWPAMEYLHVNTVEIPVYWEQFEPKEGHFDTSVVDTLLSQAASHHVRLVLLWFGTWKNGSSHYMPEWMKRSRARSPQIVGANGQQVDSPSPFSQDALKADTLAFTALMTHLKAADPGHRVIMVQVENEPGTWGSVRDYSPTAESIFQSPVPADFLRKLGVTAPSPTANWKEVFGLDADEFFHAYSVAHYIGQVAAAGKAVNPLPLYVNAALRDPLRPVRPPNYESGGATDNVLAIWKAAAPAIDILAPDIYMNDTPRYLKVLDLYHRTDNPLLVPETSGGAGVARFLFSALGRQAIGFSPFGLDYTGAQFDNGVQPAAVEARFGPIATEYRALAPMAREIAQWNYDGKLQAVAEEEGKPSQDLQFGPWTVTVMYGLRGSGPSVNPPGNTPPIGRVLVAQISDGEFVITGQSCRVVIRPTSGATWQFLRVEEGQYMNNKFDPIRIWNGDQTDWGINIGPSPKVLRVSMLTP